jgi:hypothetical protein
MAKEKKPTSLADEFLSTVSPDFVVPGLTGAQRAAREKGLGASDAERIMKGDWRRLWREKTKRAAPEDLSDRLAVQMGSVTEAFNAYWFTRRTGILVNRAPAVVDRTHQHAAIPYMLANIDGLVLIDDRMRLFEAKHHNAFGSKTDAPANNYAQMQHAMEVLDLEGCEMSVFFGNADWQRFSVERDRDYCALLMERETEFWDYVLRDHEPPGDSEPETSPALELMRQLDMRTNNEWGDAEATWIDARPHRIRFDEAESRLKAMLPADVDFAFGAELCCVRNKGGSLSLRYPNKRDDKRIRDLVEAAEDALLIADLAERGETLDL